jgi:hypothetical protein
MLNAYACAIRSSDSNWRSPAVQLHILLVERMLAVWTNYSSLIEVTFNVSPWTSPLTSTRR